MLSYFLIIRGQVEDLLSGSLTYGEHMRRSGAKRLSLIRFDRRRGVEVSHFKIRVQRNQDVSHISLKYEIDNHHFDIILIILYFNSLIHDCNS